MAVHKTTLPHQSPDLFLTDGGMETTLIFLEGFDLPSFASFDLFKDQKGFKAIQNYFHRYLQIAKDYKTGFILDSPTWRANPDWIKKLGYSDSAIVDINEKAVQLMVDLKEEFQDELNPILISGCIGPRGDGYNPRYIMTAEDAQMYHSSQIEIFSHTSVDLISALTMNYVEEAIGIVRAGNEVNLPVVLSFTVETDGKLPTGMTLKEAIGQVDKSAKEPPIYYMINCAHPSHFMEELQVGTTEPWTKRIRGIRANASRKSHAELDETADLDRGNPEELGIMYKQLKSLFNQLNVFGGCCGTDEEHVREIIKQVRSDFSPD